jgi:hypothetical protein
VGKVRIVRHFAAIEIDRQGDISLVGKFAGLFFHPVVQSPVFVNHDERGKWPFANGSVENSVDGFLAGFVGDGFAIGCESCMGPGEQ